MAEDGRPAIASGRGGTDGPPVAKLTLSEALQTLVDAGELSEGSPDYMIAQKVVREGEGALSGEERAVWDSGVRGRLAPGPAR